MTNLVSREPVTRHFAIFDSKSGLRVRLIRLPNTDSLVIPVVGEVRTATHT